MPESLDALEQKFAEELRQIDVLSLQERAALQESFYDLIHRYCEESATAGVQPEVVIRRLKDGIYGHFRDARMPSGMLVSDVIWRAVRRCIPAYYGKRG
jgi:hypothetical protein